MRTITTVLFLALAWAAFSMDMDEGIGLDYSMSDYKCTSIDESKMDSRLRCSDCCRRTTTTDMRD